MNISNYTANARKNMKGKPLKEQLLFFWEYYKWPVLVIVLVAIIGAQWFVSALTQKDVVLSGILINSTESEDTNTFLELCRSYIDIDPETEALFFQSNLVLHNEASSVNINTLQIIHANIAAGYADFITGQNQPFQQCAYSASCMLADLRNYLSDDTLLRLKDHLYYIDGRILSQLQETEYAGEIIYPSPHNPEKMADPIPVGIDISGCKDFMRAYYPYSTTVYIGISSNSSNSEHMLQFLDYFLLNTF